MGLVGLRQLNMLVETLKSLIKNTYLNIRQTFAIHLPIPILILIFPNGFDEKRIYFIDDLSSARLIFYFSVKQIS